MVGRTGWRTGMLVEERTGGWDKRERGRGTYMHTCLMLVFKVFLNTHIHNVDNE